MKIFLSMLLAVILGIALGVAIGHVRLRPNALGGASADPQRDGFGIFSSAGPNRPQNGHRQDELQFRQDGRR